MIQMVAAMASIANGGKLWQPHLVDAVINSDGSQTKVAPKLIRDHVGIGYHNTGPQPDAAGRGGTWFGLHPA